MREFLDRWGAGVAIVVGVGFIGGALFFLGQWLSNSSVSAEVRLPLLAIAGIVVLLVSLALVSVSFAALKLTDPSQALALPEGSIRAVIALSLIVLFAIIVIYLFGSLSSGPLKRLGGLSTAQHTAFVAGAPLARISIVSESLDSAGTEFTVFYREGQPQASEDFAKQLLVLIGTLVTSVSSFYFGSRAGATASPQGDTGPPSISSVDPPLLVRGVAQELSITGLNMALVTSARLVQGSVEIQATDVTSNPTITKCKVSPADNAPAGKWDLVVSDSLDRTAKKAEAVILP